MRVVAALGGNALLKRGEPLTAEMQRANVKVAADALAPLTSANDLVVTHGNGPQVGLLALQTAALKPNEAYPLDVLDAETEGMIGYLIEQELINRLPETRRCVTLLTQIEVDPSDPAFAHPTKPIGPIYNAERARTLEKTRGWHMVRDGDHYRRAVPSPLPLRVLELPVIEFLLDARVVVICAGGGGIPVARRDDGGYVGMEAVIDKDRASSLLARGLGAEFLMMLTDVDAVRDDWGNPDARSIRRISADSISRFSFDPGSMGPKVEAACEFVRSGGAVAAIGALSDARAIVAGQAGTRITNEPQDTQWW